MNKDCAKAIEKAEQELSELDEQLNSRDEFKNHIDTIRKTLYEAKRDATEGIINKDFVSKYIDKIYATPQDGQLRLEIKLFTGESCEKYLSKFVGRTGHMSLKMCPERTFNFKRLDRIGYGHTKVVKYNSSIVI